MGAFPLNTWVDCVGPVKDQLRQLCVVCDHCAFDETAGPEELTAGLARALGSATVLVCRRKELPAGACSPYFAPSALVCASRRLVLLSRNAPRLCVPQPQTS